MNEERQSDWGAETVALRGAAEREDADQREERLRHVSPRRRPTMPSPRWLALGTLVVAVALAGAILSSTSGGGDTPAALAPAHQARTEAQELRLAKARAEYRHVLAALRAHRRALRRNQRQDSRHQQRKTPHRKAAPPEASTTVNGADRERGTVAGEPSSITPTAAGTKRPHRRGAGLSASARSRPTRVRA